MKIPSHAAADGTGIACVMNENGGNVLEASWENRYRSERREQQQVGARVHLSGVVQGMFAGGTSPAIF